MASPDPRGIYFDSANLGEPSFEYVCWFDVMGTANQMFRSLPIAANFVFKLHCAVLEAREELALETSGDVRLYPVMDGVYITSASRWRLQDLLNQALCRLAITFLQEEKCYHQFLVRGAVAYGPVYHGVRLDKLKTRVLQKNTGIRDSILMGLPMIQAYQAERESPPFGISVDPSARAFSPSGEQPFRFIWLNWYRSSQPPVDPEKMLGRLDRYFDWQKDHCNMTGYEPVRIEHHRKLAHEYFTAADSPTLPEPVLEMQPKAAPYTH
jgi:hypothetical protein